MMICPTCGNFRLRTLATPPNHNQIYLCSRKDGGCGFIFSPKTAAVATAPR